MVVWKWRTLAASAFSNFGVGEILLIHSNRAKTLVFIGSVLLMLVSMGASIVYGYADTGWNTAYQAFLDFDNSNEHIIIQDVRLPRALIATVVGAGLAVSGVLLQALTNNPLASPSVFGINAGAGFFIVVAFSFFSINNIQAFTWIAFLGAGVTAAIVYILGSAGREGLTPVKLTLAGAAMAAFFSSMTQGLLVVNEAAFDEVLFWLSGSVQGRKLESLITVLPYMTVGFVLCIFLAGKINILVMGDDVANGLGLKTPLVRFFGIATVVLLSGGSVAIAGPIIFVGVVVPHITKYLVGNDYRWILPYSAVLGAILLLNADIAARYIVMPSEVPVGVMTAMLGIPFFIYIARKGREDA